jgi:hypothetical protein
MYKTELLTHSSRSNILVLFFFHSFNHVKTSFPSTCTPRTGSQLPVFRVDSFSFSASSHILNNYTECNINISSTVIMTVTCARLGRVVSATAKTFAANNTKPSVQLPSERASSNIIGQGWNIATTVKNSTVTGAGNGR